MSTALSEIRASVQVATNTMRWLLPVVLALRAWRDADGSKPRAIAEAERSLLDALADFEEHAAADFPAREPRHIAREYARRYHSEEPQ